MAMLKAETDPDAPDELSQLRADLAAAEADLASWVQRLEQGDNPDRFCMDIKRAKCRVAKRKAALAAVEARAGQR
jgi:hypothetical protein